MSDGNGTYDPGVGSSGDEGGGKDRATYLANMKNFWQKQLEIIEKTDFKKLKHQLPLARIKKIMKSDEDVRMISAEAPVLFAKACELFILDLTMRAWRHTDENKRRTLTQTDIREAIQSSEMFDFLLDIVKPEEGGPGGGMLEEGMGYTAPIVGGSSSSGTSGGGGMGMGSGSTSSSSSSGLTMGGIPTTSTGGGMSGMHPAHTYTSTSSHGHVGLGSVGRVEQTDGLLRAHHAHTAASTAVHVPPSHYHTYPVDSYGVPSTTTVPTTGTGTTSTHDLHHHSTSLSSTVPTELSRMQSLPSLGTGTTVHGTTPGTVYSYPTHYVTTSTSSSSSSSSSSHT